MAGLLAVAYKPKHWPIKHWPIKRWPLRLSLPRLGFWTRFWFRVVAFALLAAILVWLAELAQQEMRTSFAQARFFAARAHALKYWVAPGANPALKFPLGGPYDERLGYSRLPHFIGRLEHQHFAVTQQTRQSLDLRDQLSAQGYAIYNEKQHAGLQLFDRKNAPIYSASYPERSYERFDSIPPLVVKTLLFIEDKDLLETQYPEYNPAIEWKRFAQASAGWIGGVVNPRLRHGGASTLATQIEKFRHSPGGRTEGVMQKLRQMEGATLRAYLDGENTYAARQHILTTYLDSTPLSSRPGYGEVIGLGDGLLVWYGTDIGEAKQMLADSRAQSLPRKAEIYKQVLSLLLAQRRPAYYLVSNHSALEELTDSYLHRLFANHVISKPLFEAALHTQLRFRLQAPAPAPVSFVGRKGADLIRAELLRDLGAGSLYDLDHLDLSANTTLDLATQHRVTDFLAQLHDPDRVEELGLIGKDLLGGGDPAKVAYSVVLYERGEGHNLVRVHADSLDEPFDLNSGGKLQLGSTAKLRTLVNYLQIINALHDRYGKLPRKTLSQMADQARDPLSQWSLSYMAGTNDRSLQPMLDAAMQRQYSASPGEAFFTGGGMHVFHNFQKWEDYGHPTVQVAFANSINLAFVRILRDIERYYIAQNHLTEDAFDGNDKARLTFLHRFADQEGQVFETRFYKDLSKLNSDGRLAALAHKAGPYYKRLTVVFRSLRPHAGVEDLRAFLKKQVGKHLQLKQPLEKLYDAYGVDKFSLIDRGYLSRVHPLEIWLASYLDQHPDASRSEVIKASSQLRQQVYWWLFKTRNPRRQDFRIRILVEQDAFKRITSDWQRLGFPFGHLVPSLATAIGSSGDKPDALAELMGVIVNNGVKQPTIDIHDLHFAKGTPYATDMTAGHEKPQRLLPPEVAATVRNALTDVVEEGTGKRFVAAYHGPNGAPLVLGGKTGTGDNRYDSFSAGGGLIGSRVVDRTATFVFFLGSRFFGTITAYVPGKDAAQFHFTSALAVQILKTLSPEIQPLFEEPAEAKT
ncbi:MAG TPA: transglycosylase domain-containing protein [Rhizomicrobium sp.]|nr:transglycosylase domain-containing protein [Rhizomicrobium sp.]